MYYKVIGTNKYTGTDETIEIVDLYNKFNIDYQKKYILDKYNNSGYENIYFKKLVLSKKEKYILDNILWDINNGYTYGRWTGERYRYFDSVLYKTFSGNIGWSHYGSSCEKNNLDGLKFTILIIFKMLPSEFINTYMLNYVLNK